MLSFSCSVLAAEFVYKGNLIKSEIKIKAFSCGTYSIVVESDEFPFELEGKIPYNLLLKNYYGSKNVVSVKAIFEGSIEKVIPSLTDLFPHSDLLLYDGRTYAPQKVVCAKNGAIIFYWSGGNCNHCEAWAYYEFGLDGQIRQKELLPYSEVKELTKEYNQPLQPTGSAGG